MPPHLILPRQFPPLTVLALSHSQLPLRPWELFIHKHWRWLSVSIDCKTWQSASLPFLLHHSCLPDWSYFWPPQYLCLLKRLHFLKSICRQSRIQTQKRINHVFLSCRYAFKFSLLHGLIWVLNEGFLMSLSVVAQTDLYVSLRNKALYP